MIILVFFFSFAPSPSTTCGGRLLKVSTFPLDSIFRVSSALRYTNPSTHRHMTYRLFFRFPRLPLYIISWSYHARISTFNLHILYTASLTLPSLKLVRVPSHLNLFSGIFYTLSFLFHFRYTYNNIINTLRTIIRYG